MTRATMLGVLVLALAACDSRTHGGSGGGSDSGGGTGGGGGGSAGGGSAGGGSTGGGSTGGGAAGGGGGSGFHWDGGTTVDAIKGAAFCGERVHLDDAVVVGVENSIKGAQGDYNVQFWVVDRTNPTHGIYVDKFYTDTPTPYNPTPGDVVAVDGFVHRQSRYNDRRANRMTLSSFFSCFPADAGGQTQALAITLLHDAGTAPINLVDAGFGDAMDGTARPNADYAGTRVSIPGPLTLVDASPTLFKRISVLPADSVVLGFKVTGGLFVDNFQTFDRTLSDGGVLVRCDWRQIALDAGANGQKVVFPNGISGVWDTYSHAPCRDGGVGCSDGSANRDAGIVPGTSNDYTYVLYPLSCDDLVGAVADAG